MYLTYLTKIENMNVKLHVIRLSNYKTKKFIFKYFKHRAFDTVMCLSDLHTVL